MSKKIFQVPAEITKFTTMANKSLRLQVDTQEEINPDTITQLMNVYEKLGWINFVVREVDGQQYEIEPEDLLDLPPLDINKFDMKESPSKRLRNVFFVYFTQQGGKKENWNMYYIKEMEKLIEKVKSNLEPKEA